MRGDPAPAEQKLWNCLRNRQLGGFKFRRQYAVERYIADFCCAECKLVIEIDGESHEDRKEYDLQRTDALLCEHGLSVIRFLNTDVNGNLEGVLLKILEECEKRSHPQGQGPSPRLSPAYGGEENGF
jgi:very-short-patch-repair endonuclease